LAKYGLSHERETVFVRDSGSLPIASDFRDVLKIPSVMMGFGLPVDNAHAPNEEFHTPNGNLYGTTGYGAGANNSICARELFAARSILLDPLRLPR
jgi:hypothetical protein